MDIDEAAAREFAQSLDRAVCHLYLLKKGPHWTAEPSPALDALQAAHIRRMQAMADEGRLVVNGPLLDAFQLGTELRGLGVLRASSLAQAQAWMAEDPMVQAGHLAAEVHLWMVPKGILTSG